MEKKTRLPNSADVAGIRKAMDNLSQAQFAAMLGISVRTLQGWELGTREPSGPAQVLLQVAKIAPGTIKKALAAAKTTK